MKVQNLSEFDNIFERFEEEPWWDLATVVILFTSNFNLQAKPSLEVQSKGKSSEAKAAQHQLDLETLCSRFSRFSSTTVILYLQNVVRIISRRSYDPLPVS